MNLLKSSGLFVLKALFFSIIFYIVMGVFNSPQSNQTTKIADNYEAQLKRSSEFLDKNFELQKRSLEQQDRMDKILSTQEDLFRRFDSILSKMEQQTSSQQK